MRSILPTVLISLFSSVLLSAQVDSLPLDADFTFRDGVYLSLEELQQNLPAYKWKEVEARLAANRDKYFAQMEYVKPRGLSAIPAEQVYAFVLNGLPYVRVQDSTLTGDAATFAGLQIRGKVCYYTYEKRLSRTVEMAAYNPLTGKPFRKGAIEREQKETIERLLNFTDGQRLSFSRESLLSLMKDDPQLIRTVRELPAGEVGEKLYKCVLIYDDRNPIYLPAYHKKQNK